MFIEKEHKGIFYKSKPPVRRTAQEVVSNLLLGSYLSGRLKKIGFITSWVFAP